jgi:hypothetical protein
MNEDQKLLDPCDHVLAQTLVRLILVPTIALTTRPVVGIDHDRVGTARTVAGAVGTDHDTTHSEVAHSNWSIFSI